MHELLGSRFAKWQLPDIVIVLPELPRTSVGKLDKKSLRLDYSTTYEAVAQS